MPKYKLGQRVSYNASMYRRSTSKGAEWQRTPLPTVREGIIAGKRTCSDGYTDNYYDEEGGYKGYCPTKYHSFWLVAHNLSGCVHVAEEDILAVEVSHAE